MPCHTTPPALRVAPEASKKQKRAEVCCLVNALPVRMHAFTSNQAAHPQPPTQDLYTTHHRGVALFTLPRSSLPPPTPTHALAEPCTSLLKLCFPTTLSTAAMASVRLPPLLLALVLAVVLALLLPSAQAFLPLQLSSSSSLMKQQHQHRPGTNRGAQG